MIDTPKTILVVDDTEATRYAISRTLKAEGYKIVEASNGEDALRLSQSLSPDLITLDIHLPDIMGFEVCRRIKSNPATLHIPVLQVSASFVTSKDRIHGLEGGADSYLTHPFEPPVLIATVKALLRARNLIDDLRVAEERFRVALKYAPIMTYAMDRNLRYTWIYNPPKGLQTTYFLNKTDQDIYSAGDAEALTKMKQNVLRSGVGLRTTLPLTLNGIETTYDMTIEVHHSSDGQIGGLTVACIDVTERQRSEHALMRAMGEAELANQAKSFFLSNMSHEIRTPLGVIQGFADLALDPEITPSDRQNFLMTIKKNAYNLTKLLGEILDLAKIEAGRIEIEKNQFSLPDLLTEVVEALSLHASEKGLELKLKIDGPFPDTITSDPLRLRQILINLINNALKFTERGEVEITAAVQPRTLETEPVFITICIRDTGIGLSEIQEKRLFEAFMQADSSTTRKFGGTGLGLNLSKKLARSIGGDLVLFSTRLGEGSTFKLSFEAGVISSQNFIDRFKIREMKEESYAAPKFNGELNGTNVLLVEDSIDNQILFSRYLIASGATVDIANDGLEALAKTRENKYSVILMDIQMPNLDGYDATKALRERGDKTPIIALTAHAMKEERERALTRGFSGYLTKPLNPRLLIQTLHPYSILQATSNSNLGPRG